MLGGSSVIRVFRRLRTDKYSRLKTAPGARRSGLLDRYSFVNVSLGVFGKSGFRRVSNIEICEMVLLEILSRLKEL